MTRDVGQNAAVIRQQQWLNHLAKLGASEMTVGRHGVHGVMSDDEEVRVCRCVRKLALQPAELGLRGLAVVVTRDVAVLVGEKRCGVQEDGDERIGEAVGEIGCGHVPARVAVGIVDLGTDGPDVVMIAEHDVPRDVGEDGVVVDIGVRGRELVVLQGRNAVLVEVVAGGDDEVRVVA